MDKETRDIKPSRSSLDEARISWAGRLLCVCLAVISLSCGGAPVAGDAQEWTTVNKDYSSQRYVALDQITPSNVGTVKEVCEAQLNEPSWLSSGLLMVGRTLYVSTNRATYAVDAATCDLRWRVVHELGRATNLANRGPGYVDGIVFRGTGDGHVIAMDALTGKVAWDVVAADPSKFESISAAPIGWQGKIFSGIGIGDIGIQGYMLALDAKTGKELWRFHTVPQGPDDPAWKTWQTPSGGKPQGGGFWTSFSLDPNTGEVFGPVGNPYPDFDHDVRQGDNLYTNSVIALNAATGKLNWHFQLTAPDDHDWDLGSAPTLYRTPSGKDMMVVAGKDGYVYGIDRETKATVFKRPGTQLLNNHGSLPETQTLVCPGIGGGSEFNGAAYHPGIGALYIGEVDWCAYYKDSPKGDPAVAKALAFERAPRGWISSMDGATGRLLWKYQTEGPMLAGLVPTQSGLLFAGDVRGNLLAFDAKNGTVLHRINAGGTMNSGLISYAVEGTQYLAAAVGGISLNTAGVSGPLKISIFGLGGSDTPKTVKLDRLLPNAAPGDAANLAMFLQVCAGCHGPAGTGDTYPSLVRMTQLGDPEELKIFLKNVPPPMPILYPGLLSDDDVQMIAGHLKSMVVDKMGYPAAYVQPTSAGSAQWQKIYSVATHPRCINCHTMGDAANGFPRQSDQRYPHVYHIVRGSDNQGEAPMRCAACHGETNNDVTGRPGSLAWHLAPQSVTFESAPGVAMSGPQLCAKLKDPSQTGGRDLPAILDHIDHDTDVNWAFAPGKRPNGDARTTPPIGHEDFVQAFREWIADGATCPAP